MSRVAITLGKAKGPLACSRAKANGSVSPDDCQDTQGRCTVIDVLCAKRMKRLCPIRAHGSKELL